MGEELAYRLKLSSANSINWGRLVPRSSTTFPPTLTCGRRRKSGRRAHECSGSHWKLRQYSGGFYAREMGLPIKTLICAANTNNVLTDFINSGIYDRNRSFHKTVSPSMDILISSNLERLLYEITDHDAEKVRDWMYQLQQSGHYQVDDTTRTRIQEVFWSDFATDEETMATIRAVYQEYGYLLDTHTAVGIDVYEKYVKATGDPTITVVVSTASPFKFASSVAEAVLGNEVVGEKDEYALLRWLSEVSNWVIPQGLQNLDTRPIRHTHKTDRHQMAAVVKELLRI